MRVTREIEVGERKVLIKELTVGEIRAWLTDVSLAGSVDAVDVILFEDLSLPELRTMTDLSAADIEDMPPSHLEKIVAEIKEVNAIFFAMRARLAKTGEEILAQSPPQT